jgi:hypothetical protein
MTSESLARIDARARATGLVRDARYRLRYPPRKRDYPRDAEFTATPGPFAASPFDAVRPGERATVAVPRYDLPAGVAATDPDDDDVASAANLAALASRDPNLRDRPNLPADERAAIARYDDDVARGSLPAPGPYRPGPWLRAYRSYANRY